MNATSLLLLPLASAGLLVASPTVPQVESKEQLRAYLAKLDADAPQAVAPAPAPAATALASSGLSTSKLQTASGLHSAARGLTPKDHWQGLFPRYTKRN